MFYIGRLNRKYAMSDRRQALASSSAIVRLSYTLTGRQAGSLYNVKLELDSAFPDSSPAASMAST